MLIQTIYRENGIEQSMGEREKDDSWQEKDDSAY
jgi:hypothetical protein